MFTIMWNLSWKKTHPSVSVEGPQESYDAVEVIPLVSSRRALVHVVSYVVDSCTAT